MMSLKNWKMKGCAGLMMISTVFTTYAAPAGQNRRLVLDFGNQVFRQHSQIKLKQEVKKRYPNFNFQKFNLVRAVLVAKSKRGYGEAYLRVGPFESRIETIDGNRFDFQSSASYQRTIFMAPQPNDKGVWQLFMKGHIKVKRIVLIAKRKHPQRRQIQRQCQFVLETVWGKDIRTFSAQAQGPLRTGVHAKACQRARRKCLSFQRGIPLTQCTKL